MDEVLWKLIEKKFRDLGEFLPTLYYLCITAELTHMGMLQSPTGEFVEGKENMGIALERELEDDEGAEILKVDVNSDDSSKKRKADDVFGELLDTDDLNLELKKEIDELVHEEEDMLLVKNEDDEDENDAADEKPPAAAAVSTTNRNPAQAASSETVIELLDDDDDDEKQPTFGLIRQLYRDSGVMSRPRIDNHIQFSNLRVFTMKYSGPT